MLNKLYVKKEGYFRPLCFKPKHNTNGMLSFWWQDLPLAEKKKSGGDRLYNKEFQFTGASWCVPDMFPCCHSALINKQQIAGPICLCSCLKLLEISGWEVIKIQLLCVFSSNSGSFLKNRSLLACVTNTSVYLE